MGRGEECGAEAAKPLPALLLQPLPVSASPPHHSVLPPSMAPSLLQPPVQPPMQSELLPPKPVPVYSDAVRHPPTVAGKHPAVCDVQSDRVCVPGVSVPLMDGPRSEYSTQVMRFYLATTLLGGHWALGTTLPGEQGGLRGNEEGPQQLKLCRHRGQHWGRLNSCRPAGSRLVLSCPEGSCLSAGNLTRCTGPGLV